MLGHSRTPLFFVALHLSADTAFAVRTEEGEIE
jgi:hypothetical protein